MIFILITLFLLQGILETDTKFTLFLKRNLCELKNWPEKQVIYSEFSTIASCLIQ